MNFVALDFETANYSSTSACSVGLVRVEKGVIVEKVSHLIRPPTSYFVFSYLHGIKWKDVQLAPTFGELWPTLRPWFRGVDFIAAHNAHFDRRVLLACLEHYEMEIEKIDFRCTVQVARKMWGVFPTKLSDVCRFLEIELNHHEALSDAMACAQIMIKSEKEAMRRIQFTS